MAEQIFTLVAELTVKDGEVDFMKDAISALRDNSLNEDGCISYRFFLNDDVKNTFTFYEQWVTKSHWLAHMNSEHFADFSEKTKDAIVQTQLHELNELASS